MSISYDNEFKGYPVNTNKDKKQGINTSAMDNFHNHMQDMISKHDKVLTMRFDIRQPKESNEIYSAQGFKQIVEYVKRDLDRNFQLPEEGKLRSRKKNSSQHKSDARLTYSIERHDDNPHLHAHLSVLVNGNAIRNPLDVQKRLERQAANVFKLPKGNGLVEFCNKNGPGSFMLKRGEPGFETKLNAVYRQHSYVAKIRGKEDREKYEQRFGASRLPKDASR